ncbi:hypothetical protein [Flavitalea sp.]|nr:hypothetical protein [Flavitalea sp.]
MFHNYLKIALRTLSRSKGYSFINIGGLAAGMAIAILIGLWMYDELSFNQHYKNYNKIAQVMNKGRFAGRGFASAALPRPLEAELRNKYGRDFKYIVMSRWNESHVLSAAEVAISRVAGLCSRMPLICFLWKCLAAPVPDSGIHPQYFSPPLLQKHCLVTPIL